MNIFEYLRDDEAYLERHLKQMTAHCFEWPAERVFEESVKLFTQITNHLDKKETLLTSHLSALDNDMTIALKEATRQRYEIENDIDGLTQMHIDENGYAKGMESLLRKVINHRKFCEEQFYPMIERHLSKKERALINAELEDLVFS